MIAVAAVAMSFAANAAALSWNTWAYINDGGADSDWITGGQAYLVQVTDAATFAVANDLTVTGGTIVDSKAFEEGSVAGFWNTDSLEAGTTYKFAVIATTDGAGIAVPTTGTYGVDDNGGALYSVTWDGNTGGGFNPDESYGGASMSTAVGGGSSIPEPTSGLLLLLGVAGLALRRHRA